MTRSKRYLTGASGQICVPKRDHGSQTTKHLMNLLAGTLVLLTVLVSPGMSDGLPKVVVIDSYQHGYSWSDKEILGFVERMREAYPLFDPPIEHLDAKRHPEENNLIRMKNMLKDKYEDQKIDLIVAFDNPALELLIRYRNELFPGAPIVFGGINDFSPAMLQGQTEVTGVAEIMDDETTLGMALKLHPNTKEALVIHDYTASGLAVRKEFERLLPKYSDRIRFRFTEPTTIEEAVGGIRKLPPNSIGIILSYTTDKLGRSLSLPESSRLLTSSSSVPVYAMHETRLGHGIVGGQLIGGLDHGRRVAEIALRVLSGEKPDLIAVDLSGGSRPMFDLKQLERFGITSNALPPGSIVINKPESLFERHRNLIIGIIAIFALLSIMVIGLISLVLRLRSAQKDLAKSETKFRRFVETAKEGIWAMDGNYRTTFVNQRMAEMVGYPIAEMLGKSVEYFFFDEDLPEHYKNMESRRQGGDQSYERRFRRKDGSTLWTIVSATALKDDRGNFAGSFAMFTDITDKKRAEETLREKEQLYRLLAENTVDVIWQMDPDFRFTYVNQAILKATGYTRDEWIGSRLSDYCDEENFNKMVQAASGLVLQGNEGPGAVFEALMLKKDGQPFWAEIHARALFNDDRLPIGFQGVSRDITERKHAQEKLKISENRFRTLLEGAPSGFWATDPIGKNTYVSPYWTKLTGISREDALGDGWANGLHPDDRDKIFQGWLEWAGKDEPYSTEFRFINPDGRCVWVLCQASAVKTGDGAVHEWLGTITDITERKIAEEALRDSEARYRGIFEGADEGILVVEQQSIRIKYANKAMCDMLGYTLDELMGLGIPDIHPKDELDDIMAKFHLHQKGLRAKEEAIPVQRKDGSIRYVDISTTLMEINGTKCNVGFFWDITERLRAEDALRESEKRYRAVVDNLQIGISVINRRMEVVAMNPFFGSYYPNVRPGTGQICYSVYNDPPRLSPCSYCPCLHTLQDGKVHESETETPSGNQIRNFRIISCPVKDEQGEVQLVIELVEDITERRSLRSQLNQAQKMEAIGTLAGGVAHDFNNILQVIMGYSELIQDDERLPEVFRPDFIKVNDAAKRGAELVRRLLVFSRKTDFKPQPLDLNRRISDLRKMLGRTIPKMINIKLVLSDTLLRLNADPIQIDQVLMNLAVNARDAMPDGGELTFETANIYIDAEMARLLSEAHTGPYVLLTVTDNGSGMSQETMSHMFEPFYTTKSSGKGTGLGLSVVHGIVKQHEGFITCKSEKGRGTRFNIYFPAIDSDVQIEDPGTPVPVMGGSETILVVDDDDVVRGLCQQILEKAGYKVIHASNGREALELYIHHKDEISLVLLDLMMPVMGGSRCLEELLAINPLLKVIIISGYQAETSAIDLVSAGAKAAIYKPFRPTKVWEIVRNVLGKQA